MAGKKRLATYVHVYNDRGEPFAFGPNDDVPAWAAKQMGDHCWEGSEDSDEVREEEPAEDDGEVGSEPATDEDKPAEDKSPAARRRGTNH